MLTNMGNSVLRVAYVPMLLLLHQYNDCPNTYIDETPIQSSVLNTVPIKCQEIDRNSLLDLLKQMIILNERSCHAKA